MRKLMLFLTLIAGFAFSATPLVAAQIATDVDVASISESVLSADIDVLMTELETPPADADLPEAFSNAVYSDPATATAEEGVLPTDDLEGVQGSVPYVVDYDPAAGAAQTTDAGGLVIGLSSLQYVFFDDEIDDAALDEFREGVAEGMEEEDQGTAMMEDITIGGTDAVLITYNLEEEGVIAVVKMVALPVGNSMVIAMVTIASDQAIDEDAAAEDAESLTLAGAEHLDAAAANAQ